MTDFVKGLSIFRSESAAYIAIYVAFALVFCSIQAGMEFHNQSSSISLGKIALRGTALLIVSSALFAMALYITSWQSKALGGEAMAFVLVTAIWLALTWFFNQLLLDGTGLRFEHPTLYSVLPTIVLVSPFIAFNGFVLLLGSRWGI